MRLTGFITEHDPIKGSHPFSTYQGKSNIVWSEILKIKEYLNKGYSIVQYMGPYLDLETGKRAICMAEIRTDGFWIWPSYLEYYTSNDKLFIFPADFLDFIRSHDYSLEKKLNKDELLEMERIAVNLLSFPRNA